MVPSFAGDRVVARVHLIFKICEIATMLDAQGRLLTHEGGLFIDVLETAATGDRVAWAKRTICDAPFMTADEVNAYAIRVIKQLNINVTDRCISGTPTRAEYITIANGEASSTLRIDAICRERTDALQMLGTVGQIDLRDTINMAVDLSDRKKEVVCAIAQACAKMLSRPYCTHATVHKPKCTYVSEIVSSGLCSVVFKFGEPYTSTDACTEVQGRTCEII